MSKSQLPTWDETIPDLPSFEQTIDEKTPGYGESLIRGVSQGATFGFGDELAAMSSMFTDETYDDALLRHRSADKLARETNPKTFLAGELSSALIPGSAPLKLASTGLKSAKALKAAQALELLNKSKTLKGVTGKAAIEGALYGAGTGEGNLMDRADNTIESGLLSAGVGGTLKGVGEGLKAVSPYLLSGITATKPQNIIHYAQNKDGVRKMMSNPGEMENIVTELKDISENMSLGTKETRGEINDLLKQHSNINYPEEKISDIFDKSILKAKEGGDYSKNQVINELERLKEAMLSESKGSGFSPQNIKKAVDIISPIANPKHGTTYYGEAANQINAAKDVRYNLNDLLKNEETGVPGFRDAMSKLEKDTVDAKAFEKLINKNPDTLLGILKRAEKGNQPFKLENIEKYASKEIPDFGKKLKDYSVASDFMNPKRDMFNNALPLGSLAYGVFGSNPMALGVAGAGFLRNQFGGRLAPIAVDAAQKTLSLAEKLNMNPATFGRFAPILLNAQKRGDTSLQATHYLLQKQNPEYRKMMEENEGVQ